MTRGASIALAATLILVPMAFMPGVFLYYDITPKILAFCFTTAVSVFFAGAAWKLLAASGAGRRVLLLIALQIGSLVLSTALSVSRAGSMSGSTWRRFGFPVQISLLVFFLVATATISQSVKARTILLRTVAGTSVVTCVYGIIQYIGLDPFIQGQLYSVGQYNQTILRPPSTLGSATNFGNFALATVFLSIALWRENKDRAWRYISMAAGALGLIGMLLSGTRASLLGLAIGLGLITIRHFRKITRPAVLVAILTLGLFAGFYFSPLGFYLRNRSIQSWGDWKGGTRTWLWRDSLRMFAARPILGYGLDTFAGEFPKFQSSDLSQAYPDSYNESPHNLFLDVLLAQGIVGLATFVAMLWIAFASGPRRSNRSFSPEEAVHAGLAGLVVAHLFFTFEVVNAIYFYFAMAILVAGKVHVVPPASKANSKIGRLCQAWAAVLLAIFGFELAAADRGSEKARKDLVAGNLTSSVRDYEAGRKWFPLGYNSSLWYSRALLGAAQMRGQVPLMLPEITLSATDAFKNAEDRHNACYHLAMLYASEGQLKIAAGLIKQCIDLAPTWYVAYWAAASIHTSMRDYAQAERMAVLAVEYSGKHRPEMIRLLDSTRTLQK